MNVTRIIITLVLMFVFFMVDYFISEFIFHEFIYNCKGHESIDIGFSYISGTLSVMLIILLANIIYKLTARK